MAGRPRTPSKLLELRGTFKQNPQRKRVDAEGQGRFDPRPPTDLPEHLVECWRAIASRLPLVAFYDTDTIVVEMAARALYAARHEVDPMEQRMARDGLLKYLVQLGMTPAARTKIPATSPGNGPAENPYSAA